MSRITPFLWFDTQAEEAAEFYTSIFENSRILEVVPRGPDTPGPDAATLTVRFELDGSEFVALNGGAQHFSFNESVSFVVTCRSQEEVDHYWGRLVEGGEEGPCGWLKDRFGLSWQVVPAQLPGILGDPDPSRAGRAMRAMLSMTKLDLGALERAAEGGDE
jgi:predicted 3-demethylubiquinone-9 3-methyltransferase (glyoxalase superfamily)